MRSAGLASGVTDTPASTNDARSISACSGFYLVFVQMNESVGFPFTLPVGDLTRFWPQKKKID